MRSLSNQGAWAIFSQVVISLLGVVSAILTNRGLEPQGRGEAGLLMLLPPLLASMGAAGWTNAIMWHVARFPRESHDLWKRMSIAGMLFSLILIVLGVRLVPSVTGELSPGLISLGQWFLVFIPLAILSMVTTSVLEGNGRFDATSLVRTGNPLLVCILLGVLIAMGRLTVMTYIIANLAAIAVTTFLAMWLITKLLSPESKSNLSRIPPFISRVAPAIWFQMLQTRIDQLWIVTFFALDSREFGVYLASVSVASFVLPAAIGLAYVLIPATARLEGGEALELFARVFRLFSVLAGSAAVVLGVLAAQVLSYGFGEEFASGAGYLQVALFGAWCGGVLQMGLSSVQALGRPGFASLIAGYSCCCSVIGIFALANWNATYFGVVVGQTFGLLLGVVGLIFALRKLGLDMGRLIPGQSDFRIVAGAVASWAKRI
jgi:O-antigen/teichoic acid export membrane protein